ncbi:hypothetical protein [Microbulbifer sp. HZ11]|uniref:hypothetical protein n=1 Tax=Microbulbifer sp. HZ11 TaxID=1453501 RepID=UPI0005BD3CD4|nr:hypothetical protein [Microbulbifer sp. HZ11]
MEAIFTPQNYQEWRHCITVTCGLELTEAFINSRITSLKNESDYMTKRFVELYGEARRQRTLEWFVRASEEIKHPSL